MTRKAQLEHSTCTADFQSVLRSRIALGTLRSQTVRLLRNLWTRIAARSARHENGLRLVEMVGLGEKRFVAVVEYRQEQFLLGGAPGSVCLLSGLQHRCESGDLNNHSSATAKRSVRKQTKKSSRLSQTETSKIVALLDSGTSTAHLKTSRRKPPSSLAHPASTERFA